MAEGASRSPWEAEAVVFDLDDTLWDVLKTIRAAHEAQVAKLREVGARGVAEQFGEMAAFGAEVQRSVAEFPEHAHDFTFTRKVTLRRLLKAELFPGDGAQEPLDAKVEEVFQAFFEQRNRPVFFPGAVEALRDLQGGGWRLGVISDGNANVFQIPELAGLFDFAVSATEAGAPKPDVRPFALAQRKAGDLAPGGSGGLVYVGDNYLKDVVGAKAAGWRAVWVAPPVRAPPAGSLPAAAVEGVPGEGQRGEADALLESVTQLRPLLEAWRRGGGAVGE